MPMRRPSARTVVQHTLLAAAAAITVGSRYVPARQETGPVLTKAVELVGSAPVTAMMAPSASPSDPTDAVGSETKVALDALAASVRGLSDPRALEDAFRS